MSGQIAFIFSLLLMTSPLWAGTQTDYVCTTNAKGEAVLDEAVLTTHQGQTKQQIIQKSLNAYLRTLSSQQEAAKLRELNAMLSVATPGSIQNAETALLAGITAPDVNPISNQTHNVGASPTIPIVVTNHYPENGLSYGATGLPPGMALTSSAMGEPQISGQLTTAGTYTVVISAWNFDDKKGTTTFQWVVLP